MKNINKNILKAEGSFQTTGFLQWLIRLGFVGAVFCSGLWISGAQAGDCVSGSLYSTVEAYSQEGYGKEHQDRWESVLDTFDGSTGGMDSAEAERMYNKYSKSRWEPVLKAIQCLEDEEAERLEQERLEQERLEQERQNQQQQQQNQQQNQNQQYSCVSDSLYNKVLAWSGETWYGPTHVSRWESVLDTFDGSANGMDSTEAEQMYNKYSKSRWEPVLTAIECIEGVTVIPTCNNGILQTNQDGTTSCQECEGTVVTNQDGTKECLKTARSSVQLPVVQFLSSTELSNEGLSFNCYPGYNSNKNVIDQTTTSNAFIRCSVKADVSANGVTVNYQVIEPASGYNWIATSDESGSFTFGSSLVTTFDIPIIEEGHTDPHDAPVTFTVKLLSGTGYTLGSRKQAQIDGQDSNRILVDITATEYEKNQTRPVNQNLIIDEGENIIKVSLDVSPRRYDITIKMSAAKHQGNHIDPRVLASVNGREIKVPASEKKVSTYFLMPVIADYGSNIVGNIRLKANYSPFYSSVGLPNRLDILIRNVEKEPYTPDPNRITADVSGWNAKACVKNYANIKGQICGADFASIRQGVLHKRVLVEYAHNANTPQDEGDISFYLYPVTAGSSGVRVKAVYDGYMQGEQIYTVPEGGMKVTLPEARGAQYDWDLDVTFKTVGSNYEVYSAHEKHKVKVKDNDPVNWYFVTQTLGDLDEGTFDKAAILAFQADSNAQNDIGNVDKSSSRSVLEVDFNISGCALQNTAPAGTSTSGNPIPPGHPSSVAVGQDIPCRINISDTRTYNVTRLGLDRFRVTFTKDREEKFLFTFQVGQDDDKDDEVITWNPVITMNSSGAVNYGNDPHGNPSPTSFTAYDDDATLPDTTLRGATTKTTYLAFTLDKFNVVENNGPAQPTIKAYQVITQADYNAMPQAEKDRLIFTWPCNSSNIAQQTECRVYDPKSIIDTTSFYVRTTGITAVRGDAEGPGVDFVIPEVSPVIIPPKLETGKFDIATVVDNVSEVDETLQVEIIESRLPKGFVLGSPSTATITILDTDQTAQMSAERAAELAALEAKCGSDYTGEVHADCKPVIKFELVTKEINESDFLSISTQKQAQVTVRVSSNRAVTGGVTIEYSNEKGDRYNKASGSSDRIQKNNISLQPDVPQDLLYLFATSATSQNDNTDYPDGQIFVKPVSGVGVNNDYTAEYDKNDMLFWIRDDQKSFVSLGKIAPANTAWTDNVDNFFTLQFNKSFSAGRDLETWETLEVPITVTGINGDTITPADYEIKAAPGQDNVSVRKRADGTYTVKAVGKGSGAGSMDCGEVSDRAFEIFRSRTFCLIYVNKRGGAYGLENEYDIVIDVDDSDPTYGATNNVDYEAQFFEGVDINYSGFETTVEPGDAPASSDRIMRLVAVDSTTITEPAYDPNKPVGSNSQPWVDHAFDVIIEPGPSGNGFTRFDFCVDLDVSTASYYYDLRIVDAEEHYHNAAVGGFAYDANSGCTKGIYTWKKKTRYYLRVHGDAHDEGSEIFKFKLRINNPNPDNVTADPGYLTYTITNDGPLPKQWLSRFGHSVADQVMDIVSQRVKAPRKSKSQLKLSSVNIPLPGQREDTFESRRLGQSEEEKSSSVGSQSGSSFESQSAGKSDDYFQDLQLGRSGGEIKSQTITSDEIRNNASFETTMEDGSGGFLTTYGRIAVSSFNADVRGLNVESTNRHVMFGVDYARDKLMWGLGFGAHTGEGSAGGSVGAYDIDSELSTMFGYGARSLGNRSTLWGVLGYGKGDIQISREKSEGSIEEQGMLRVQETKREELGKADTSWQLAGLGFDAVLRDSENSQLSLVGDAFLTGIDSEKARKFDSSSSSSHRLRIGLENSFDYEDFSLSPSLFLRRDGGDVDNESNLELGLSSDWELSDKLFLNGRGSYVLDNDNKFKSYSFGLEYSPEGRREGRAFSVYSLSLSEDDSYVLGWRRELGSGAEVSLTTEPRTKASQFNYVVPF